VTYYQGQEKLAPTGRSVHLGACQCGLRVRPLPHIAGMMRSLCTEHGDQAGLRSSSLAAHQNYASLEPGVQGASERRSLRERAELLKFTGEPSPAPGAGGPCSPVTRMQARYAGGRHVPTGSASGVLARRASRNGTCGPGAFRSGPPPGQRGKNAAPHASAAYGGGARRWCVGYSAADPPGVGDQ
jgi:hypothetical protein